MSVGELPGKVCLALGFEKRVGCKQVERRKKGHLTQEIELRMFISTLTVMIADLEQKVFRGRDGIYVTFPKQPTREF